MAQEKWVKSQVKSYQRQKKKKEKKRGVLDATLLNIQHYKVQIKGKVEQSKENSSALPYTGVVANEKGAFRSQSPTTVTNFTYYYIWY